MKFASVQTEPASEPVTLAELRSWLRIDGHDEDADLARFITAARIAVENRTWSKLISQTIDLSLDAFAEPIQLQFPPVASITSITYTATSGNAQTVNSSVYELGELDGMPVVRLQYSQTWPTPRAHPDSVTVRYVSGYGSSGSDVPQPIRDAIKMHAAHGWWNRGDAAGPPLPEAFTDLLSPYSHRMIR